VLRVEINISPKFVFHLHPCKMLTLLNSVIEQHN
jgi:hypothetical protein